MWTYLDVEESVSTFSLLRMIEPFDADIHRAVPRFPQTDDSADVRYITSCRDEYCTVTNLPTYTHIHYMVLHYITLKIFQVPQVKYKLRRYWRVSELNEQVMQGKKQKISMILNENKKQVKLLRTWRQLVDCSRRLPATGKARSPTVTSLVAGYVACLNINCNSVGFLFPSGTNLPSRSVILPSIL